MQRHWWIAWGALTKKLFALTGSAASVTALLITFLPPSAEWQWRVVTLLVVAVVGFIVLVIMEIVDHKRSYVFDKTDTIAIEKYMHNWIGHGSRVAIWTRDMSWADNERTKKLLIKKAQHNELILCLPSFTKLASELESVGAEVCCYGQQTFDSPASRFTIAHFGRDGSSVAVGRAVGGTHVIDEFRAGDHPAYHLAADLVSLVRLTQGRRHY